MNTYVGPGESARAPEGEATPAAAPVTIVDYGAGNLASVANAFRYVGAPVVVTSDPERVARAERLVLPGVGSFGRAMDRLKGMGLDEAVRDHVRSGRPFLGVCLGLQLLLSESEETGSPVAGRPDSAVAGRIPGLGLVPGVVRRLDVAPLKVPHVGWNQFWYPAPSPASIGGAPSPGPLFEGVPEGSHVYFVHSYHADPDDPAVVSAYCDYGIRFACAISRGNIHAVQFHPEKSGPVGLAILRNFSSLG